MCIEYTYVFVMIPFETTTCVPNIYYQRERKLCYCYMDVFRIQSCYHIHQTIKLLFYIYIREDNYYYILRQCVLARWELS